MARFWRVLILVGCVWSLMAPAQALGVILVPPGKSGANQYFEDVPTSQGSAAPPSAGSPGSGGGGGGSTHSTSNLSSLGRGRAGAAQISRLGSQGQGAAALARVMAPHPAARRAQLRSAQFAAPHGGSALGAIANALGGSGGLGLLLPLLLAAAALGAFVVVLARLRSRGAPPQAGA